MHFSILSKSVYESELLAGVALWEHFSGREMGDGRFQGVLPFLSLNPKRLEVYAVLTSTPESTVRQVSMDRGSMVSLTPCMYFPPQLMLPGKHHEVRVSWLRAILSGSV